MSRHQLLHFCMWKQIKTFHCEGKRLLTTVAAIPFLFFNQLELSGVFEYCNIPKIRPPMEEYKTTFSCTFQCVLPSSKARLLTVPSLQCLCGSRLMTWNILSLSSKPDLPSTRFHLGYFLFSFCIGPYRWESVLVSLHNPWVYCIAFCVYVVHAWYHTHVCCVLSLVLTQRLRGCKSTGPGVRTYESVCVPSWMCLLFTEHQCPHLWNGSSFWSRTQFAKMS